MKDIRQRLEDLDPAQKSALAQALKQKMELRKTQSLNSVDYDVVIMGGGLAGSTLARQILLDKPDVKILVVEKKSFPFPEGAFKVGESASEVQAHYYGEILGLKKHFCERQIEKGGARYFFPFMDNSDIARRMEVGLKDFPPVPGYQFDRGRLETFLFEDNSRLGITYWDNCKVENVVIGQPHVLTLKHDKQDVEVSARWVVDAGGRAALLKRKLDLAETTEHAANAAWFRLPGTVDIDQWSNDSRWRNRTKENLRKVSTSHLMGKGYWVWIIVLPTNATSIGLVADPAVHSLKTMNRLEHLLEWLQIHEPQLAAAIEQNKNGIQDFTAFKHFSHGCKRVFSPDRWCITGDAGVFLDPFYSPGGDFIAIGNSLIKELIVNDLNGEFSASRIEEYNCGFLGLFKLYLLTYNNQYPVMGNSKVMLAKIIWDWAIYWGVNAFLFFNGNRAFDTEWLSSVRQEMSTFNRINTHIQNLFPIWSQLEDVITHDNMFSLFDLEFLYKLHTGLATELTEDEVKKQLVNNIQKLEVLAKEYVQHVNELKLVTPHADITVNPWDIPSSVEANFHPLINQEMLPDLTRIRTAQLIDCNV